MPDLSCRTDKLCNNLFPVIYSDARTDVLDRCLEYNEKEPDEEYLSAIYKYGVLAKVSLCGNHRMSGVWYHVTTCWRIIITVNFIRLPEYT